MKGLMREMECVFPKGLLFFFKVVEWHFDKVRQPSKNVLLQGVTNSILTIEIYKTVRHVKLVKFEQFSILVPRFFLDL